MLGILTSGSIFMTFGELSMICVEVARKVEFNDCDPMGVVWNGKYFDYFESARSELLARLGISYMEIAKRGYMLPLVKNKAKYVKPLLPGMKIVIRATLISCDVFMKFRFEILDEEKKTIYTKGESAQMLTTKEGVSVINMPAFIENAIKTLEGGDA